MLSQRLAAGSALQGKITGLTMHRNLQVPFLLAFILLLTVWHPALADDTADQIEVHNPWVRETPPNQTLSVAFMVLQNNSAAPARLVAVKSPDVRVVELHQSTEDDGMMGMQQLDSLALPPGEPTVLEAGGTHLMLIGMDSAPVLDESVALHLYFQDGSHLSVDAAVRRGPVDNSRPHQH